MATLHLIEHRHDTRTRYLVDAGLLLVPTHGWRYAAHFMLSYDVPVGVLYRLLARG